jgi:hypothetical protein
MNVTLKDIWILMGINLVVSCFTCGQVLAL